MTTYTYQIVATVAVNDRDRDIMPGDILCDGDVLDSDDLFDTESAAIAYGQQVLNGLDGGPADNLAFESAEVRAVAVS